jgi:hypothetical protein
MNPEKLLSSVKNIKALSQVEQIGQNVVDDLINSWWKILIGVAIAVAICIIYIVIMRWLAALMVWLSLVGVLALLIAGKSNRHLCRPLTALTSSCLLYHSQVHRTEERPNPR